MQKVYLLLRSNKQTGPYSLEELLQLNLKPFDLVWMEGRSAAWQYPSEIPTLKPYVPETPHADAPFKPIATAAMEDNISQDVAPAPQPQQQPQNSSPLKTEIPKRVFVSVPKTYAATNEQKPPVEQPAYQQHKAYMPPVEEPSYSRRESYAQQTVSSQPSYSQRNPVDEEPVTTNYSRSMNDVEEAYTNWVYNKKTKKKASVNPKDLVLGVLILAVIGGGYYIMSRPSIANSVLPANKLATERVPQPAETNAESEPKEILSPEQRVVANNNDASNPANSTSTNVAKLAKTNKTKNPLTVSKSQNGASVPSQQSSMPVEKTNPNIHDQTNDVAVKEPEAKQQPGETVTAEKKKKFGEVIKGIFSKKEKKEDTQSNPVVLEDPKPANNRQASRRETEDNTSNDNSASNEISTASLMEMIDITSNAPDNWMMGVKNLKVTLKNRSNVTIQTAAVAVNYYDENNQLLEKKLIYFNNVAPKAKATVAAPDHKFADHVDFRLTSANAKEDKYAKN